MADEYSREVGKNDNAAKTLAILGIILAMLALGWAMKADKRAGDAANNNGASQSQGAIRTTSNEIGNGMTDTTSPSNRSVSDPQ